MEKIKINNFQEELYYEKLKNGLEVFLVPLLNKKAYYFSMGIKYGNCNTSFKVNGNLKTVPSGVAHFLEHKLFEREVDLRPFDFFAKSGSDVNAATSTTYTNYYVFGSTSYEENLKYFLNWLTKLEVSLDQVEKEKGIILEEAKMCLDNPNRFIYEKSRENTFVKDPCGKKVIGEMEDILNITKEDLDLCYKSFYRPDNMFLIVTGNFNPNDTIKIIKKELKDFKNPKEKIEKIIYDEDDKVLKETDLYYKDITNYKIELVYKMNLDLFNIDKYKLDIYLSMLLSLTFGNTSLFKEEGLKNNWFTSFGSGVDFSNTHLLLDFSIECNNDNDLILEKIEEVLKNIKIKEEDFIRMKKAWIAAEVRSIDNVTYTAGDIFTDIITYNSYKNNKIEDINSLSYKELQKIIKCLSLENKVIVKVNPFKK